MKTLRQGTRRWVNWALALLLLTGCKQTLEPTPLLNPIFDAETLALLRATKPLNVEQNLE